MVSIRGGLFRLRLGEVGLSRMVEWAGVGIAHAADAFEHALTDVRSGGVAAVSVAVCARLPERAAGFGIGWGEGLLAQVAVLDGGLVEQEEAECSGGGDGLSVLGGV